MYCVYLCVVLFAIKKLKNVLADKNKSSYSLFNKLA